MCPTRPAAAAMHLLYLDDSGSVKNKSDRHIVLAGLAVFERQGHWISRALDNIAKEVWPDNPKGLEFRGSDMFSGRRHWRGQEFHVREKAYCDALSVLARNDVRLFGAAIHKAAVSPDDPMEFAFEQMSNRFDRMLGRMYKKGNTQRGLVILDKSSYETSLQTLAINFRTAGHRWGRLYNIAEVPLFVDSRATRLIQCADLIAYAIRRYHEAGQSKYIDIILPKFDSEGGVLHGLTHYTPSGNPCNCHSCRP